MFKWRKEMFKLLIDLISVFAIALFGINFGFYLGEKEEKQVCDKVEAKKIEGFNAVKASIFNDCVAQGQAVYACEQLIKEEIQPELDKLKDNYMREIGCK